MNPDSVEHDVACTAVGRFRADRMLTSTLGTSRRAAVYDIRLIYTAT